MIAKMSNGTAAALYDGKTRFALPAMRLKNKITLVGMEPGPFEIKLSTVRHSARLIVVLGGVTRVDREIVAGIHSLIADDAGTPLQFCLSDDGSKPLSDSESPRVLALVDDGTLTAEEAALLPGDIAALLDDEARCQTEQPFLGHGAGRLEVTVTYWAEDTGSISKRFDMGTDRVVFQLNTMNDHLRAIAENMHRISPTMDPEDKQLPGLWRDLRTPETGMFEE